MRDEDVVRAFVAGATAEQLIERIAAAEVAFDLDPEMLDELRGAGLPEPVVQAMIDRQRELDGDDAEDEPAPAAADPARPVLRVLLVADRQSKEREPRPALRVPEAIPPGAAETLGLADPEARFSDIAVLLACLHPVHVPDHWRGKTPLGRDFVSTPRHRLLAFHPGAVRRDGSAGSPAMLELEIPDSLEAPVENADDHDLLIGIALQVDDRFYLVARDVLNGLTVAAETEIRAEVRGAGGPDGGGLLVKFLDDAGGETP
jgi:hypothetical protein